MTEEKKILNLVDRNIFNLAEASSWCQKQDKIEFNRVYNEKDLDKNQKAKNAAIIFTESGIDNIDNFHNVSNKKYAWLIETPALIQNVLNKAKQHKNKFDKIFVCHKELLDKEPDKFFFCPGSGCWIWKKDFENKTFEDFPKTKNISIIASQKKYLRGHKIRHDIIRRFRQKYFKNDTFGRGAGSHAISALKDPGYKSIENKLEGLKDYRFSFAVENHKSDYYFTEKLIDCFVTRTIPIFWGCPSISKFFDTEGIVIFDKIDDLENILPTLNEEYYEKRKDSIEKNYHLAKEYTLQENYILKHYIE